MKGKIKKYSFQIFFVVETAGVVGDIVESVGCDAAIVVVIVNEVVGCDATIVVF